MPKAHSIALIIIDMQNDFVLPGAPACVAGAKATLPALRRLLDRARNSGWRVIHVRRSHRADGSDVELFRRAAFADGRGICVAGSHGAEPVAGLEELPGEVVLHKLRFSAFLYTEFDAILRRLGVETLVLCGTQYPNCLRATAVDAMSRDYRVLLATDACSAQTQEVAQANINDLNAMGIACAHQDELPGLPGAQARQTAH
jgi:nicotinamidase-related amidase